MRGNDPFIRGRSPGNVNEKETDFVGVRIKGIKESRREFGVTKNLMFEAPS